ncbi:MAG TPA: hypothetical protein VER98_18670 [Terriglobia bacterium]|nr:hypothetical protein [Terriglobia bacterium]
MTRNLSFLTTAFSLIVLGFFCSNLMASDWDKKTEFTINQPVSIPGHVVLSAGTYVIKRLDAVNSVVRILDKTETKVYATLFTIPDIVMNPPDKPMFTFQEMPEGALPALKSWYYPGSDTAYEFVN